MKYLIALFAASLVLSGCAHRPQGVAFGSGWECTKPDFEFSKESGEGYKFIGCRKQVRPPYDHLKTQDTNFRIDTPNGYSFSGNGEIETADGTMFHAVNRESVTIRELSKSEYAKAAKQECGSQGEEVRGPTSDGVLYCVGPTPKTGELYIENSAGVSDYMNSNGNGQ